MRLRPAHLVIAVTMGLGSGIDTERAASSGELPFAPGERMTYEGRIRSGVRGKGTMWIEGPVQLRGTTTWLLH